MIQNYEAKAKGSYANISDEKEENSLTLIIIVLLL